MSNLSTGNLITLAVAGVMLLLINGGPLLSWLTGAVKSGVSGLSLGKAAKGAIPDRRTVLDDLDSAYSYFESVGCTDGMAAITTAATHAFSQHEKAGE